MYSKGSRLRVVVTHVEVECGAGRGEIWAQTDTGEYEKVEALLQSARRCSGAALSLTLPPQRGDLVVAEYSDDSQWYRAVVLEASARDTCLVHFIDFGNVQNIRIANMIQPLPQLRDIPGQAQKFFIEDVLPRSGLRFSDNEIEFLMQNLLNQEFNAEVVSEGITGFPSTIRLEADLGPLKNQMQYKFPPMTQIAKQDQLFADRIYEVKVTNLESKLDCYVQLLSRTPFIDKINVELNCGVIGGRLSAEELFPGLICAAQRIGINSLARAIICKLDPSAHSCTVTFIDYGSTEKVDISRLHALSPEFLSIPPQAIHCCIFGQLPGAVSLKEFVRLAEFQGFVMKVRAVLKSQQYLVEIVHVVLPSQVTSAPQELENQHATQQISGHNISDFSEGFAGKDKFLPLKFDITQMQNVCISNVNEDGSFNCQLLCFSECLNSLMMMVNHTPIVPIATLLSDGLPCIVRSPYDRILYRAIILQCQPGTDRIIVELVDFGTRMETTVYDIHALTEATSMFPVQAIACRLFGADSIPPATLVPLLRRFESKVALIAQIVEKRLPLLYVVNLFDTSTGLNTRVLDVAQDLAARLGMNQPLATKNLVGICQPYNLSTADAPPPGITRLHESLQSRYPVSVEIPPSEPTKLCGTLQSPPSIEIPLQTSLQIHVTSVTGTNSFFGQLYPSDRLNALQDDIQRYYTSSSVPYLQSVMVGLHCCCQRTDNHQFYRAKVLYECQTQWVVEFIDSGLQEVKDRFQLKVLLPQFASLPRQSIRCMLSGEYEEISHDLLTQLLLNETVMLCVVGQNKCVYIVRLAECESNQPVLMKLSRIVPKKLLEADSNQDIVVRLRSLDHATSTAGQLEGFRQPTIPKAEWLECEVTFVESPSEFYCQLLSDTTFLEEQLMVDIGEHIATLPPGIGHINRTMLGLPVLAQFSSDTLWYRARITGVLKTSNRVEVYFVDYGNHDTIEASNIREIPAALLSPPEMVFRCSLAGLIKGAAATCSSKEIELFEETVTKKSLKVCYVGEKDQRGLSLVHLLDEQENINRSFLRSIGKLSPDYISPVIKAKANDNLPKAILANRQTSCSSDRSAGDGWLVTENHVHDSFGGNRKLQASEERRTDFKGGALFQTALKDVISENAKDLRSESTAFDASNLQNYDYPSYHPGQFFKCTVAYIFHPGKFFCHRKPNEALDKLSDDLNTAYGCLGNGDNAYHVLSLAKGQSCCAKYSEDDMWYRGKVLAVDSSSAVRVQFVDYGNEETVSPTKIRLLSRNLFQTPVMAIPCCLNGIEPATNEWSARAISRFNELAEEQDLTINFVAFSTSDNVYKVELSGPSGITLQSQLVRDGLAKTCTRTSFGEKNSERNCNGNLENKRLLPQNISLQPQVLSVGSSTQVYVSFAANPGYFWCQVVETASRIDSMIEALTNYYNSLSSVELALPCPAVGQICCARFSEDEQWYRADIIDVNNDEAKIRYIDYGNEDKVLKKSLRTLKPEFASLPPQAFKCYLFGISSAAGNSWSSQAITAFGELTDNKVLKLDVKSSENGQHGIELFDSENNMNISSELVRGGHASHTKSTVSPDDQVVTSVNRHQEKQHNYVNRSEEGNTRRFNERGATTVDRYDKKRSDDNTWETSRAGNSESNSRNFKQERSTSGFDSGYSRTAEKNSFSPSALDITSGFVFVQPSIEIGSKKRVITSWFTNPADFFVQLEESTSVIEKLQEDLHNHYHLLKPNDLTVSNPCPEQVCAALFHEDCNWYRGRVLSVKGHVASVMYVDYGNVEQVQLSKMKGLVEQFGNLPVQAIRCALSGAEGQENWDAKLSQAVSQVFTKTLFVSFKGKEREKYLIEVLNKDGYCINNDILKLENVKKPISQNYRIQLEWKVLEEAEVEVVAVEDEVFYCQLVGTTDGLDEMMNHLAECCEALPSEALQLTMGQPCASRFSEDGAWYRAKVESVLGDGQFMVRFIDYGNKEIRPHAELRALKSDFLQLPIQCYKCRLTRKLSDGISLCDVLLGQKFRATLKKVVNEVLHVDLLNEEGNVIGDNIDSGSMTSDVDGVAQVLAYDIPTEEMGVYITNAVTPGDFYLQLVDHEDRLVAMGDQIHAEYEALAPNALNMSKLEVGKLCCAKFSEDSVWYRAMIKESDGITVKVLFIDYGNFDVVSPSDVKELNAAYEAVPCFAFHCSLSRLNSKSDRWTDEQIAKFVELTQSGEKAFICKFLTKKEPFDVELKDGDEDVGSLLMGVSHPLGERAPTKTDGKVTVEGEDTVSVEDSCNDTDKITVYVSNVNTLNDFYIQFASDNKQLTQMSAELEEYVLGASPLDEPVIGSLCASIYSLDGAWYRARIKEIHDDSSATIFFIDYGNVDVVQLSTLKVLNEALARVRPFARNCCIAEMPSSEFDSSVAIEMFTSITSDEELDIVVSGGEDKWEVKLLMGGEDIMTTLLKKLSETQLSQDEALVTLETVNSETSDAVVKVSEVVSDETVEGIPAAVLYYLDAVIPSGKLNVVVTSVRSVDHIFVQLAKDSVKLESLLDQLDETYAYLTPGALDLTQEPVVGQACCACYSNVWYRAKVQEVHRDGTLSVCFVDSGRLEVVEFKNVKQAVPELLDTRPLAVECYMVGCREKHLGDDALKERLQEYVSGHSLIAQIFVLEGQPPQVIMYNKDICINSELFGLTVTELMEELQKEEQSTKSDECLPDKEFCKETELTTSSLDENSHKRVVEGNIVQVHVTSSTSLSDFWVSCPAENPETDLPLLMDRIEDLYSGSSTNQYQPNELQIGMLCVAKFSDGIWYRARIIQVFEHGTVQVFFIDYGNVYEVSTSEIRELVAEHAELAPQAIQATLATIGPCISDGGWDAASSERFVELVTYESKPFDFNISKVVRNENGQLLEVHGLLFDNGVNIGDQLVKEGFAVHLVELDGESSVTEINSVGIDQRNSDVDESQSASNVLETSEELIPNEKSEMQAEDSAEYAFPDDDAGMLGATSVSDEDNTSNNLHLAGTDVAIVNEDVAVDNDYNGLESANFDEEISTVAEESVSGVGIYSRGSCDIACMLSSNSLAFPFVELVNGDVVEATIMSLDDSNGITCQLVNTRDDLNKLMESLQLCCQGQHNPLDNPEVGQPCAVKVPSDGDWFRAQIKNTQSDGGLEVYCVDRGLTYCVYSEQVQILQAEFLELPAQALNLSVGKEDMEECLQILSPESTIRVTVINADASSHRASATFSSGMPSSALNSEVKSELPRSVMSEIKSIVSSNLGETVEVRSPVLENFKSTFENINKEDEALVECEHSEHLKMLENAHKEEYEAKVDCEDSENLKPGENVHEEEGKTEVECEYSEPLKPIENTHKEEEGNAEAECEYSEPLKPFENVHKEEGNAEVECEYSEPLRPFENVHKEEGNAEVKCEYSEPLKPFENVHKEEGNAEVECEYSESLKPVENAHKEEEGKAGFECEYSEPLKPVENTHKEEEGNAEVECEYSEPLKPFENVHKEEGKSEVECEYSEPLRPFENVHKEEGNAEVECEYSEPLKPFENVHKEEGNAEVKCEYSEPLKPFENVHKEEGNAEVECEYSESLKPVENAHKEEEGKAGFECEYSESLKPVENVHKEEGNAEVECEYSEPLKPFENVHKEEGNAEVECEYSEPLKPFENVHKEEDNAEVECEYSESLKPVENAHKEEEGRAWVECEYSDRLKVLEDTHKEEYEAKVDCNDSEPFVSESTLQNQDMLIVPDKIEGNPNLTSEMEDTEPENTDKHSEQLHICLTDVSGNGEGNMTDDSKVLTVANLKEEFAEDNGGMTDLNERLQEDEFCGAGFVNTLEDEVVVMDAIKGTDTTLADAFVIESSITENREESQICHDLKVCENEENANTSDEILQLNDEVSTGHDECDVECESGLEGCPSVDDPTSPTDEVSCVSQSSSGIGFAVDVHPHEAASHDEQGHNVDSTSASASSVTASDLEDHSSGSQLGAEMFGDQPEEC